MTETIRLHDYQDDIKQRLFEAWKQHRSVMVQMPTGTGKTYVLAATINEELGNEELRTKNEELGQRSSAEGKNNEECVWIIAHRRELVAQIEETVSRMLTSTSNSSFFVLNSSFTCSSFTCSSFIKVMSIQWLSKHWEDIKERPSLVIIDEAHHAQAKTYRMLWEQCPNAKFLGLTATPCRLNGSGFTDLFDTLITSWSIPVFIEKGYLSAFDYVAIRANSKEQRLIDSLEKRGADGDYQIKEMNRILNRSANIKQLYQSVERFANGKKGIVYAISIDHARSIAEYYNNRGIVAVAIDSKTPAAERKQLVEDFKAGKIKVLVNVDVFSEGFDCPDVEFVQMARPTLSLSKYLQQVGRGLRKSMDKESCVLIDNVGLYRVFGLPTVEWDWEAMFRGFISGKGKNIAQSVKGNMVSVPPFEESAPECDMEVIVSHQSLLADLHTKKRDRPTQIPNLCSLKAWQDEKSGLWGLKRGHTPITDARFVTMFDIRYELAAVRFKDYSCGLIDASGNVIWKRSGCNSLKFSGNRLLAIILPSGKKNYVDLYSLNTYDKKPQIKKYGNIELLKVDSVFYSRTKKVYMNNQGIDDSFISFRKFYLAIFDYKAPSFNLGNEGEVYRRCGYACILSEDSGNYYWHYRTLKDKSIFVADCDGRFYHASEKGVRYVGNLTSAEEREKCRKRMVRLAELAKV